MERPEAEHRVVSTDEQATADRLLQSIRDDLPQSKAAKPKLPDIEKESQIIADLFDIGKNPMQETYGQKVSGAVERLSTDLRQLSGNMGDYNKLLLKVAEKIPDEPASNPMVDLNKWQGAKQGDLKNGSWGDVSIVVGEGLAAYRIVQPGNTLSEIARDTKGDRNCTNDEYMRQLATKNKIADPNRIYVGQAISLLELH